jgi:hypothetical protein
VVAATWRVEKDGSGDFTVIQDAVDAAADGDTIAIGPGRYDEKTLFVTPGWSEFVRVIVRQEELTIIGSGLETIIGQEEPWELDQGWHRGIVAGYLEGLNDNRRLLVEGIRFENMAMGIYTSYEGAAAGVKIRDCEFAGNRISLLMYEDGAGGDLSVSRCRFESVARDGLHLLAESQARVNVSDCALECPWNLNQWPQLGMSLTNIGLAEIERCRFSYLAGAWGLDRGTRAVFRSCEFENQRYDAGTVGPASEATIIDCTYRDVKVAVVSGEQSNRITMRNCDIQSVEDSSFNISSSGYTSITGCNLAAGERGAVWIGERADCGEIRTLDFTDNWWGTADRDSIASLIRDHLDDEDRCYIVDFEPFREEVAPTQVINLGDVKSLFR